MDVVDVVDSGGQLVDRQVLILANGVKGREGEQFPEHGIGAYWTGQDGVQTGNNINN